MNTQDRSFGQVVLDLIYPLRCSGCGEVIPGMLDSFCLECLSRLQPLDYHHYTDNPLSRHFVGRCKVELSAALFGYIPGGCVQQIIHDVKYRRKMRLGRFLGRWLGRHLQRSMGYRQIDVIIPVPLHKRRQRKRGYNQSSLICEGIADQLQCNVLENGLERIRKTPSQTDLNRFERHRNMKNAFWPNEELLRYDHVLLVDDVVTTGATLEACILAIKAEKDMKVSIGTVALGGAF
ncbi:MAG: ComF family protein [Saprospiraceae bacterium]|nr:ComF family protein [Saprospiraceae bacterium]